MAWYILLGTLAAFGGLCLLWGLAGWFVSGGEEGILILPGHSGQGEPGTVRWYLWLRELGLLRCRLVVEDFGLSPGERTWLENRGIERIEPGAQLPDTGIGAREIDGTGNGNSAGHHQRGGVPEL